MSNRGMQSSVFYKACSMVVKENVQRRTRTITDAFSGTSILGSFIFGNGELEIDFLKTICLYPPCKMFTSSLLYPSLSPKIAAI